MRARPVSERFQTRFRLRPKTRPSLEPFNGTQGRIVWSARFYARRVSHVGDGRSATAAKPGRSAMTRERWDRRGALFALVLTLVGAAPALAQTSEQRENGEGVWTAL